ncbi:MAG: hypothetical protein JRN20_07365 [Nitrososphaerota archaeon]|nr:hypothetical protein [Nitrososphaerota archaeon]
MIKTQTIITYSIGLFLALITALFVKNILIAFGIVLFLLLIEIMIFIREAWKSSDGTERTIDYEPKSLESRYLTGQFSSLILNLRLALKGDLWCRRDIAVVLREALLNKYAESKDYPAHWVHTESGKDAIQDILGAQEIDLLDVLELPDPRSEARQWNILRRRERKDDHYPMKLDRVLRLVENETKRRTVKDAHKQYLE